MAKTTTKERVNRPPAEKPWVPTSTFGSRCLELRKAMGMTGAEIAKLCDIDPGTWSYWERGGHPQKMDEVVRKIVAATGVDRDWLMWGGSTLATGVLLSSAAA